VCGRRFSTYEQVLRAMPLLVKGNGDREAFDREKLIRGIQTACAKRPIPAAGINALVDRIATHLQQLGRDEVSSRVVGDMVIEGMKELDPIAYIRYAIVYLGLDSVASVRDLLDSLLTEQGTPPAAKSNTVKAIQPGTELVAEASARSPTGGDSRPDSPSS
jgi:transcriptional repressor NrdR